MLRRRFGKTNLDMSVLSFGAMRIPPVDGETPEANRQRAFATLRRGLDVGINHVETARGYGLSQALIGQALAEGVVRRDEFLLTTKIGPTETAAEFRSALDDSMQRMGVTYVDNLDIHGINAFYLLDLTLRRDGCLAAARRAIDEGIVGHIGFSTHAPLEVILAAIETDEFESVNLHCYYINQRNRPAVELAARKDMGVYIISPTDKGGQLFNPPQALVDLCAPFTPIELNHRWLLAQPEVHSLSLGAARPEEYEAHLAAAERGGPLTADEAAAIARLDARMASLGATLCTFCHECLPCPEDVQIPEILRLRNLTVAYEMSDFARYRYGMMAHRDPETGQRAGGAGHWFLGAQGTFCTNCGDCLPRCPVNLPIPDLLRETHETLVGRTGKRLWK